MRKVADVIGDISKIIQNDPSQFAQLFGSREEIFKLVREEINLKNLLATSWEEIHKRYSDSVSSINENSSADVFCRVLIELTDLLYDVSEREDYYFDLSERTGTWVSDTDQRQHDKMIYLDEEYDRFMGMLLSGENFVLTRSGDGERALAEGRKIRAQENWAAPEGMTELGKAILESYQLTGEKVYHGISCPCCDPSAYLWYLKHVKDITRTTFANLWVNSNYSRFEQDFPKIKRDAIVIGNHRGDGKQIGNLNILKYYPVSDDCVGFWETEAPAMIKKITEEFGDRNDIIYVLSAGPMSNPIIAELYRNNPNNCYIDFGSSIDPFIHEKITRPYMVAETVYAKQNCSMSVPANVDKPDISVVLTMYKRPDRLITQLEAIEAQSVKPSHIFLFQDHIDNGVYTIELRDEIKKRFDGVHICEKNVGVWDRFKYAYEVCDSNYVCIFDDDTIPGKRWLENCYMHMIQQHGIYVTIGVSLKRPTNYPGRGWYRTGWGAPYQGNAEVDFGGHSWFVKKEYLKTMAEEKIELHEKYKYVGEDAYLSFSNLGSSGVRTIVPRHYNFSRETWGSDPVIANTAGTDKAAVSMNVDNMNSMRTMIKDLDGYGWKYVCDRHPDYFADLYGRVENLENNKALFDYDGE
ncbi:MAG: glycosyltransferase [Lachnospiraceae bacterium]|nr:glycosyltransferase [Lachnospiraceae bacterium]